LHFCAFALSLWGFTLVQLAFYRPESKESSAFPKPYPLRRRVIRDEMISMGKNAPSQLAEAVAAGGPAGAVPGQSF
jgi:hypothetical protein